MKGYIYNNELEAIQARKQASDFKGLPLSKNDITQFWVNYEFSELDNFYYIIYVDGLQLIFGTPVSINLTNNDELNNGN